jgi:hypothetical protein
MNWSQHRHRIVLTDDFHDVIVAQEPFQDGPRSIRMMAPSGWNKFEGEVGAYDLKWQDLVDSSENIKISSTPVKSTTTSVDVLGDVQTVGESLASKRQAKLVSAKERLTDGILFYKFDFALKDGTHQLLQLCVAKGKLWSVDASAKEKRWTKRSELYENVLVSSLGCVDWICFFRAAGHHATDLKILLQRSFLCFPPNHEYETGILHAETSLASIS